MYKYLHTSQQVNLPNNINIQKVTMAISVESNPTTIN